MWQPCAIIVKLKNLENIKNWAVTSPETHVHSVSHNIDYAKTEFSMR